MEGDSNIRGVVLIAGHGGKSTRKMLGDRPDWVMDVLDSHHFFCRLHHLPAFPAAMSMRLNAKLSHAHQIRERPGVHLLHQRTPDRIVPLTS